MLFQPGVSRSLAQLGFAWISSHYHFDPVLCYTFFCLPDSCAFIFFYLIWASLPLLTFTRGFPHPSFSLFHSFHIFPSPLRRFLPQFLCVHGFFFLSFFPIFTTVLVCDWPRCVMRQPLPPRPCPWTSHMQWVALSGLWVRAAPPQALRPLAGCTGAFPGQVLFITCVCHRSTLSEKHPVSCISSHLYNTMVFQHKLGYIQSSLDAR